MKRYIITEHQLESIVNTKLLKEEDTNDVLNAFDDIVDELGLCTIGEDSNMSDIINKISQKLKKPILIASAIVALGLMTPQEAQAQTGAGPKDKIVNIFKKRQKMKCEDVGKQKIKTGKVTEPTRYFVKTIVPKFGSSDKKATFAFVYKGGEYKPVSKKVYEKNKDKVNFVDMSSKHWEKAKDQVKDSGKSMRDVGFYQ